MRRQLFLLLLLLIALSLGSSNIASTQAQTGSLTGAVRDPNNAVVAGAQVTIRNETTNEMRNATTDNQGAFKVDGLAPGSYEVKVERNGFKTFIAKVVIEASRKASLDVKLEIAETRAEVSVGAKGSILPNSDPNYRALRDAKPGETYTVSNLTLKRDAATIKLTSGHISFIPPVLDRVAIGVFVGEGEFTLDPFLFIERNHLKLIAEKETITEAFSRLVLAFTENTYQEIKGQGQSAGATADNQILDTLRDLQNRLRNRERGSGENLEAELLSDLYNPRMGGAFNAFIFGKKRSDLRFHIRPRGALDCEEVMLLYADWNNDLAGVWYSGHFDSEYKKGSASSEEDKRVIDIEHYKIENAIKGEKLTATAEMTFTAMVDGERVLGLGLLPELRVSRVLFVDKETNFIQEDKKKDGSFYAIFPEPLVKGRKYKLTVDYQGDKVLENAGGGNFAVQYRTSWYPSVNSFNDRATFDLTFKVPKQNNVISVGKMVKEWQEGDFTASQWTSDIPLAVAGFNYGRFKKKEVTDSDTKYQIEGYAVSEMPDGLRNTGIGGMAPTRLLDSSLAEATNSMRVFTHYFGPLPYGRIAITQQPQANFGQAWPTLVFLPLVSYLDSTQRWMLLGNNRGLTEFVDEVNAHEVSHQWWGHIVGWSSYHDQWLSEGTAFFSAGLYLKATEQKPDKYLNYWKHAQEMLLEKNEFGFRRNDAGPLWLGWRSSYHKIPGAYQALAYRKGGYAMHMLHQMMYDRQNGDKAFIAMMQDFVKSHHNQNASTESFRQIVDKHMLPKMDLAGNKKMDWFFHQWVYGTEIPRYRLDYTLTPQADGKCLLTGTVTQSDVSQGFRMLVPVYLDFDGKSVMRLGEVGVMGNSTSPEFKVMLPQKPKRVLINANYDVLAAESISSGK
jgi:hypothetical protein